MENYEKVFKDFLKIRKLKYTRERETIIKAIFSTHDHFDAEDLEWRLRKNKQKISKATIYRTLDILIKSKLITEHEIGTDRRIFEHIHGHRHHDHLVCLSCGIFIEFDDERIEKMQDEVCKKLHFYPDRHSLKIFGLCRKCKTKINDSDKN
ncbi:MAG: transcriptional repressor [Candidatus Schekmanbacteria bacterium]|nr:transcriptional repressor [Candidatus Schekmanbacteria bacterium]